MRAFLLIRICTARFQLSRQLIVRRPFSEDLKNRSKTVKDQLKDVDSKASDVAKKSAPEEGSVFSKLYDDAANSVSYYAEQAKSSLTSVQDGLTSITETTWEKTKEVSGYVAEQSVKSIEKLHTSTTTIATQKTKDAAEYISEETSKSLKQMGEATSDIVNTVSEKTKEAANYCAEETTKSLDKLRETTTEIATQAIDKSKEAADFVSKESAKSLKEISDAASDLANTAVEKTKETGNYVVDETTKSLDKLRETTTSLAEQTMAKSKKAADYMSDEASKSLKKVGEASTSLASMTAQFTKDVLSSASSWVPKTGSTKEEGALTPTASASPAKLPAPIVVSKQEELPKKVAPMPMEIVPKKDEVVQPALPGILATMKNTITGLVKRTTAPADELELEKQQERRRVFGFLYPFVAASLPAGMNPAERKRAFSRWITDALLSSGNTFRGVCGYYLAAGWRAAPKINSNEASSAAEHFLMDSADKLSGVVMAAEQFSVPAAIIFSWLSLRRGHKFDRKSGTVMYKVEAVAHIVASSTGSFAGTKLLEVMGSTMFPDSSTLIYGMVGALVGSAGSLAITRLGIARYMRKNSPK
ncbi:unnamed protein product, partial [Mesorhabditis spiculigera]